MMNENKIKSIVNEVRSYLEAAVGDVASSMISFPDMSEDKWKKKITAAKNYGTKDLVGWLADELYNDVDTIEDLIGDRIFDLTNGNDEDFNMVCSELAKSSHKALATAAKNHLIWSK